MRVEGTRITNHGILSLAKLAEYSDNLEEFFLGHDDKDELKSVDMLRSVLKEKGMEAAKEDFDETYYKK